MTTKQPNAQPCPLCGTATSWEGNANRPFCSERCKMIDLGKWAMEDYSIPGDPSPSAATDDDEEPIVH